MCNPRRCSYTEELVIGLQTEGGPDIRYYVIVDFRKRNRREDKAQQENLAPQTTYY